MQSFARLRTVALVSASTVVFACTDQSAPFQSLAPHTPVNNALADTGNAIRGTAILTVRTFARNDHVGTVATADTGTFTAMLTNGGATQGSVRFGTGGRALQLAVDVRTVHGTGQWDRSDPAGALHSTHATRYATLRDGPLSDVEIDHGGGVMERTHLDWQRSGSQWLLRERSVTVLRDGAPVATIDVVFAPERTTLSTMASGPRASADEQGGEGYDSADGNGGDCRSLIEAANLAFDAFTDALEKAARAATSGTAAQAAAAEAAVLDAAADMQTADGKADRCRCGGRSGCTVQVVALRPLPGAVRRVG